jgi:hypothetical protein
MDFDKTWCERYITRDEPKVVKFVHLYLLITTYRPHELAKQKRELMMYGNMFAKYATYLQITVLFGEKQQHGGCAKLFI